jgi:hypothetical protein
MGESSTTIGREAAHLEVTSERKVPLYERLGFRSTGELRAAGSRPLRPTLRPPTPSQVTG